MKYKEIRNNYQNHDYQFIVDPYVCLISPIITKFLIKTYLTPNMITVLMIISGIIGAILFALPSMILKIIGVIFIHMWYVLDCCDGEVARIKKNFSKFGKEIDYTAHIINHPLFTFSFMISMIQLSKYNRDSIFILFMVLIVINLVFRNLLIFNSIYEEKMIKKENSNNKVRKKSIVKKIQENLIVYPNFSLLFPIIYMADLMLNTSFSFYYVIIFSITSFFMVSLKLLKWITKIINE